MIPTVNRFAFGISAAVKAMPERCETRRARAASRAADLAPLLEELRAEGSDQRYRDRQGAERPWDTYGMRRRWQAVQAPVKGYRRSDRLMSLSGLPGRARPPMFGDATAGAWSLSLLREMLPQAFCSTRSATVIRSDPRVYGHPRRGPLLAVIAVVGRRRFLPSYCCLTPRLASSANRDNAGDDRGTIRKARAPGRPGRSPLTPPVTLAVAVHHRAGGTRPPSFPTDGGARITAGARSKFSEPL